MANKTMVVYHIVDPDLQVEPFFEKKGGGALILKLGVEVPLHTCVRG